MSEKRVRQLEAQLYEEQLGAANARKVRIDVSEVQILHTAFLWKTKMF